jgi:CMP-N,N'-diacetyllegionaminic acid synthase
MRILFLITARGGSKGVPGKNLRTIAGLSLVGYKARSARKSRYCTRLMISTDSVDIQDEARRHGVEVPFTRPAALAIDEAKSSAVVAHAMDWIEAEGKERYDAVMLLEPSSPFARASDYDAAVELLERRNANAVVGVRQSEVSTTVIGPVDPEGRLTAIVDKLHASRDSAGRRQSMPREFTMNGALYLFRWEYFRQHEWIYHDRDGVYAHLMDRFHSVEIDEPVDLAWAEFLAERGYVSTADWGD